MYVSTKPLPAGKREESTEAANASGYVDYGLVSLIIDSKSTRMSNLCETLTR